MKIFILENTNPENLELLRSHLIASFKDKFAEKGRNWHCQHIVIKIGNAAWNLQAVDSWRNIFATKLGTKGATKNTFRRPHFDSIAARARGEYKNCW